MSILAKAISENGVCYILFRGVNQKTYYKKYYNIEYTNSIAKLLKAKKYGILANIKETFPVNHTTVPPPSNISPS